MNDTDVTAANRKNMETERYFRQMALDLDATQRSYQHILTTIDTALNLQKYDTLQELIPYIEKGDGHFAFQYIGKTHRILRILNILSLEGKYHKPLFCQGCNSMNALWERYMLTLFAFRRILFQLSEESQEEAVTYLQSNPISHLAAYIMVQDELIIPDQYFHETLALIYSREWSPADMQQFFSLMNTSPHNTQQENPHERS